jgi:uncharacterized protein YggE
MSKDRKGIRVVGRGEVLASPDTATVDFGISVLGDTVATAAAEASQVAGRLVGTLKESGVAPPDIATTQYGIAAEYDWANNERRLLGYRVNNTVRALIRDIGGVGRIVDAAVSAGGDATQVGNLQFGIEDETALLAAARDKAWADALAKAGQLAGLAGLNLGEALRIEEGTGLPGPIPLARMRMAAEMASSTPIEGGSATVSVELTVHFDVD